MVTAPVVARGIRSAEHAMLDVFAQFEPAREEHVEDLLTWSERRRFFRGEPMHVPGPLREIYQSTAEKLVVMKGAQMGLSEWAINLALWTADTGRARRGNALYVQPSGENVGDFVQARVNPALEASEYLATRIRPTGSTKDPDKVGLRRIGRGYTYWRTARSKSALKSVDADTLILDEYDEMPAWTLALAEHRLDSSEAPMTRILSTPTYPGAFIDEEYLGGDRRQYALTCDGCGTEQVLLWEKHVREVDGERRILCADCQAPLEAVIARAWQSGRGGRWVATNPDAPYPSYQISQLYRPGIDLNEVARDLRSPDITNQQEAWNQHLALPFSPPGGQLSLAELQRLCVAPFRMADIAGVQGCWMGVDVGSRLHVWLAWDDAQGHYGDPKRYLVGALEVDGFDAVDGLMQRFGVQICVVDAHPELHYAQAFQRRHPGRVYLADYVAGRMPPAFTTEEEKDPKRRWRVQVDRTGALDATMARLRGEAIAFPEDAESIPGFFAMLQAPVRRMKPDANGNPRAIYDEGSRADHYAHAAVYAELASYIGGLQVQRGTWDARTLSDLGSWDRGY